MNYEYEPASRRDIRREAIAIDGEAYDDHHCRYCQQKKVSGWFWIRGVFYCSASCSELGALGGQYGPLKKWIEKEF